MSSNESSNDRRTTWTAALEASQAKKRPSCGAEIHKQETSLATASYGTRSALSDAWHPRGCMRLWVAGPQPTCRGSTPLQGSMDRPRPVTVLRFELVSARASKDRKGFITGLRHHLHGGPRPRSYTNYPLTNKPTNQPAGCRPMPNQRMSPPSRGSRGMETKKLIAGHHHWFKTSVFGFPQPWGTDMSPRLPAFASLILMVELLLLVIIAMMYLT
jgi:hypothetical protein